jgi:nucleotide-binding universal stress UspA family protein
MDRDEARRHGLTVVKDRCIVEEHRHLFGTQASRAQDIHEGWRRQADQERDEAMAEGPDRRGRRADRPQGTAREHARRRVRLAVEWGTATVEILRYARSHDVDLIAMGRHGRSGITHMLLGSVADKAVCHAPCAVLSVGY